MIKLSRSVLIFTVLFLLSISVFIPNVNAEKASLDEMRLVCQNWLNNITYHEDQWASSNDPKILLESDIVVNDTLVGRYFEIEPVGFIVVPILKEMVPIKIYSDENFLDWSEPDGPTAMIKEVLAHHVRNYVAIYGSVEASQPKTGEVLLGREQKLEWNRFLVTEEQFKASLVTQTKGVDELGPLLNTAWHQGEPFNNDCPWGDGGRCVVGCVATATAQIMTYHRWPIEGYGNPKYYWSGDQSCGGTTPMQLITVNLNDPYDWDNIPADAIYNGSDEQEAAMAELNHEVGVAFSMNYGRCASGAYGYKIPIVFGSYFRYFDQVETHERANYTSLEYSDIIKSEILNNRPCQYNIHRHSIVCDGWRLDGYLHQYHMNYGWGGSQNLWFTIDNLYCPWEGCSYMVEEIYTNIVPDRGARLVADTLWGQAPLEVNFDGFSPYDVDEWIWNYDDGDSASVQSPTHLFTTSGQFDIELKIVADGDTSAFPTLDYITVLADTLDVQSAFGSPGDTVEVVMFSNITLPLNKIKIPVEYSGSIDLRLVSFSTEGCITDCFDVKKKISSDNMNKLATFSLYNYTDTLAMPPGNGPIIKLYFLIAATATYEQSADIIIDGYSTHELQYFNQNLDYVPFFDSAEVALSFICGDCNNNGAVNILDITYLIGYLYQGESAPIPERAGDVNHSGTCNILDITYMISYLYKSGAEPNCL